MISARHIERHECVHNLTACPRASECHHEAASAVSEFQGTERTGTPRYMCAPLRFLLACRPTYRWHFLLVFGLGVLLHWMVTR